MQNIILIFRQMVGFICTDPTPLVKFERSILVIVNLKDTVAKLDAFCASRTVK